jgi:DinB family protein
MNPQQCRQRPDGVWVCGECGFAYELTRAAVMERLSGSGARLRAAADAASDRYDTHPRPEIWTPRQYLAHMADWAEIIADRVEQILNHDRPMLALYDQDQLATERAYHTWDVQSSLDRFDAGAERVVRAVQAAAAPGWDRVGVRKNVDEISVSMLANDLVHELEHHVHDVTSGPVTGSDPASR